MYLSWPASYLSSGGVHIRVIRLFHPYLSFFFSSRRRHTRFDCDWSSDVCSSDLPNDHVNMAQSTNDVFPTAMRLSAVSMLGRLVPELQRLANALDEKGVEFADVIKRSEERRVGKEFRSRGVPEHEKTNRRGRGGV